MPDTPLKIAVLISGGGTTLRNLLDKIAAGQRELDIRLVISSNPRAKGLEFARSAGIEHHVVERRAFDNEGDFGQTIFDLCRAAGVQTVVMGGFLKHLPIPPDFENRVVNIHPALIPAFCGQGFYGHHVHEAVLANGSKISGCTVHFVDNLYDHGPIILQRSVPVFDTDSPDTLAARVFEAEREAYPEALGLIAAGRVRVEAGIVRVSAAAN